MGRTQELAPAHVKAYVVDGCFARSEEHQVPGLRGGRGRDRPLLGGFELLVRVLREGDAHLPVSHHPGRGGCGQRRAGCSDLEHWRLGQYRCHSRGLFDRRVGDGDDDQVWVCGRSGVRHLSGQVVVRSGQRVG